MDHPSCQQHILKNYKKEIDKINHSTEREIDIEDLTFGIPVVVLQDTTKFTFGKKFFALVPDNQKFALYTYENLGVRDNFFVRSVLSDNVYVSTYNQPGFNLGLKKEDNAIYTCYLPFNAIFPQIKKNATASRELVAELSEKIREDNTLQKLLFESMSILGLVSKPQNKVATQKIASMER